MALKRLFIANRGEIALRIVRAAQALNLETVVGVSDADRGSAAAKRADRAVILGPGPASKRLRNLSLNSPIWFGDNNRRFGFCDSRA